MTTFLKSVISHLFIMNDVSTQIRLSRSPLVSINLCEFISEQENWTIHSKFEIVDVYFAISEFTIMELNIN